MTLVSEPVDPQARIAHGAGSPPANTLYEKALTLSAMGLLEEATRTVRKVTASAPDHGRAWQTLAALLRMAGKDEEAVAAEARAAVLVCQYLPAGDKRTPADIDAAEEALRRSLAEFAGPERLQALRQHLREHETDAGAMRLLGRLERDRGNLTTARHLFERALDLAPAFDGVREDLAILLGALGEHARALTETACLMAGAPDSVTYRAMHAEALRNIGDLEAAIPILEQLIAEKPSRARLRCIYARTLHFAGRGRDSAREYRAVLEMRPKMGEAWWGLAELRGDFLTAADATTIREHLGDVSVEKGSRMLMQYTLGRVLEQAGNFAESFAAYQAGATLARSAAGDNYDVADDLRETARRRAVFTERALSRSASQQAASPTPVFIVGMPRAGSTLVEQILASHSMVEGTKELPVIGNITRDLSQSRPLTAPDCYPECVPKLTAQELAELGARYLREAGVYRRTNRPVFVDKCPWNWLEAGFIGMILPHAKIVDIRREPMAACFAMYKQELSDIGFASDFDAVARYYTEYAALMTHYDRVMPGRIHFLQYERLVADTEGEVRRLLDHCGLPFEDACLRFWQTPRSVVTPSAEQVRRPIFREGLDQWRNFEPWLAPLKRALETAAADAAIAPQPEGYDLALTFAAMSLYQPSIETLRAVTRRAPTHAGAWSKLADMLRLAGKDKAADEAAASALRYEGDAEKWRPTRDLRTPLQLEAAKRALEAGLAGKDRAIQAAALREHLAENPTDAAAAHALSDVEWLDCDPVTSFALLERALDLSPSYDSARQDFVAKLVEERQHVRALEQAAILLRDAPEDPYYRIRHVEVLEDFGMTSEALAATEELVRQYPRHPGFWLRYGMLLRAVGKREESARAFRACLEMAPAMGEAYACLADLKGSFLTETDLTVMRSHLADISLAPSSRMHMYYALGHALERSGDFAGSFAAYQGAARLARGSFLGRGEAYDEKVFVGRMRRLKRVFSARLLSRSSASPEKSVTPIFVVGMPRAGSTLVEQILASHSQVEGTRELGLIAEIVRELATSRRIVNPDAYPECVRDMTASQLAAFGQRYLEGTLAYRRTSRAYFVDKRPWNWIDAGLIHLILPHAKIIDIRREPMAACFAMFKQQLPKDCAFSYDLRDLGHYYNIYVSVMEHWKSVMPNRIHLVQYERLVRDTETEIRRMLDYCGLPFESGCLRFWETERTVSTPSAEQVRRPIYREAVELWRNFEPWLGPLEAALADPPLA